MYRDDDDETRLTPEQAMEAELDVYYAGGYQDEEINEGADE